MVNGTDRMKLRKQNNSNNFGNPLGSDNFLSENFIKGNKKCAN